MYLNSKFITKYIRAGKNKLCFNNWIEILQKQMGKSISNLNPLSNKNTTLIQQNNEINNNNNSYRLRCNIDGNSTKQERHIT